MKDYRRAHLDALKWRIPPFVRDGDVEVFLDWEMKANQRHADTWPDLRGEIRSRFVFVLYVKDLYNKLQRMYHGLKSMDEYCKDIKVVLLRANVVELYHYTSMAWYIKQLE
ncbi:hypothetical protein CR513_27254, partial [Mucuna pruriens]